MKITTVSQYTKYPQISFREQLREFVRKNSGCTGAQARKGIAKNADCARFIVTETSVCLNDMARQGILLRDKQKYSSFYSINPRRFGRNGAFLEKQGWGEKAKKQAKRNYEAIRERVRKFPMDIRDDVLSEAYVRMADGLFDGDIESLLEQARFHVQKEFRGGWRESYTVDGGLNDEGFSLLDVLSDEDVIENKQKLYLIEKRVDTIKSMEAHGYEPDQYSHLWFTNGTTWGHRYNG